MIDANALRHDAANALSSVRACLEGIMDGVLDPSPERLAQMHAALLRASDLLERSGRTNAVVQRYFVPTAYDRAAENLPRCVAALAPQGVAEIDSAGPESARHRVRVEISEAMKGSLVWSVAWGAPDATATFSGLLSLREVGNRTAAAIELSGDYRAPADLRADPLDPTAGMRVAAQTARLLLKHLGDAVVARG